MHYGSAIIEHQKKSGRYGQIFNYHDYQNLKSCQSLEDFQNWIKNSPYSNTSIFENPIDTCQYLELECQIQQIKKAQKSQWTFLSLSLVNSTFLPMTIIGYLNNLITLKSLQRKQAKISAQANRNISSINDTSK